jgi:hypothetical protein
MESPLGEDERRRGIGWSAVAGAAVAGLLVLGGYLVAGDDGDGASMAAPTTTTVATPTTPPPAAEPGFPAGYTPVTDLVAVRPERVLLRDGVVFVSLSQAVLAGLDAAQSSGLAAGAWELIAAGTTFPMLTEFRANNAPGTVTVAFEAPVAAADVEGVRLVGEGFFSGTSAEIDYEASGLPFQGPESPWVIDLEPGTALVVDDVSLRGDGGAIEWHLEGDGTGGAVVSTTEVWLFTAASPSPAAFMPPQEFASFLGFFGSAQPLPQVARSGTVALAPPVPDSAPTAIGFGGPDDVTGVGISLVVDWITLRPAAATVPLAGVEVVEVP